ncbi:MAG: hypothetical protein HC773_00880 [Scytonema sp. CRU_2_7]|nr:hypothetical protein [Scytonema sp. CRU_2_7]
MKEAYLQLAEEHVQLLAIKTPKPVEEKIVEIEYRERVVYQDNPELLEKIAELERSIGVLKVAKSELKGLHEELEDGEFEISLLRQALTAPKFPSSTRPRQLPPARK